MIKNKHDFIQKLLSTFVCIRNKACIKSRYLESRGERADVAFLLYRVLIAFQCERGVGSAIVKIDEKNQEIQRGGSETISFLLEPDYPRRAKIIKSRLPWSRGDRDRKPREQRSGGMGDPSERARPDEEINTSDGTKVTRRSRDFVNLANSGTASFVFVATQQRPRLTSNAPKRKMRYCCIRGYTRAASYVTVHFDYAYTKFTR